VLDLGRAGASGGLGRLVLGGGLPRGRPAGRVALRRPLGACGLDDLGERGVEPGVAPARSAGGAGGTGQRPVETHRPDLAGEISRRTHRPTPSR
jgi:hypothetical protein